MHNTRLGCSGTEQKKLWKQVKVYGMKSLFLKNFFMIAICILVSLIILISIIYWFTNNIVRNQIFKTNSEYSAKIVENIENYIERGEQIACRLSVDKDVLLLVDYNDDYGLYKKYMAVREVQDRIKIMCNTMNFEENINLYFPKTNCYLEKIGSAYFRGNYDIMWHDNMLYENYDSNKWYSINYRVTSPSGYGLLGVYQQFRDESMETELVVVVNIGSSSFKKIINQYLPDTDYKAYIIDSDEEIVFDNMGFRYIKNESEEDKMMKSLMTTGKDDFFIFDDRVKYVVSLDRGMYSDWTYMLLMPVQEYQDKMEQMHILLLAISLISFSAVLILSFVISYRIYQPFKYITTLLKDTSTHYIPLTKQSAAKLDEIEYIASNIMDNRTENVRLEEELDRRIKLLQEAQMTILQYQVNPHFLYNTLETVNWKAMALIGRKNEISDMMGMLSRLLRIGLDNSRYLVSINEEIDYTKLYTNLQCYRFKDKMDVEWDIENDALEYQTVKFSLQPLVENAIYHGIRKKKEKGLMVIQCRCFEDIIEFSVSDDGIGMDDTVKEELSESFKGSMFDKSEHIGLRNVNQRIQLIFGQQYGLKIDSESGKGTKVKIIIPKVN